MPKRSTLLTPAHPGATIFDQLRAQAGERGFTFLGRQVAGGSKETFEEVLAKIPAAELESAGLTQGMLRSPGMWAAMARNTMEEQLAGKGATKVAKETLGKMAKKKFEQEGWGTELLSKKPSVFSLETIFNFLDAFETSKTVGKGIEFAVAHEKKKSRDTGKMHVKEGEY